MLWTPPSQFVNEYDDTTTGSANPSTMATGIVTTASGSTNTKGNWAQVVSATDRDWYGFWLQWGAAVNPTGLNASQLLDIGIGGAGSEVVLLADFLVGGAAIVASTAGTNCPLFWIPLFVPKGVRVACRTQSATASRVVRVNIIAQSGGSLPTPIFSGCDTYGVSTAASNGTSLTNAAGSNAFGAWTNVGSTTSRDYKGLLMSSQGPSSTTVNSRIYLVEGGYNSTRYTRTCAVTNTSEMWLRLLPGQAVVQFIPSGTQFQGRISSGTTSNADLPTVAFHCFY